MGKRLFKAGQKNYPTRTKGELDNYLCREMVSAGKNILRSTFWGEKKPETNLGNNPVTSESFKVIWVDEHKGQGFQQMEKRKSNGEPDPGAVKFPGKNKEIHSHTGRMSYRESKREKKPTFGIGSLPCVTVGGLLCGGKNETEQHPQIALKYKRLSTSCSSKRRPQKKKKKVCKNPGH